MANKLYLVFIKTDVTSVDFNHFNKIFSIVLYGYVSKAFCIRKGDIYVSLLNEVETPHLLLLFVLYIKHNWVIYGIMWTNVIVTKYIRAGSNYTLITGLASGTYILIRDDGAPPFIWHQEVIDWWWRRITCLSTRMYLIKYRYTIYASLCNNWWGALSDTYSYKDIIATPPCLYHVINLWISHNIHKKAFFIVPFTIMTSTPWHGIHLFSIAGTPRIISFNVRIFSIKDLIVA